MLSFDLESTNYSILNHEALDLLREMLRKDYRDRIDAAGSLEHSFLR